VPGSACPAMDGSLAFATKPPVMHLDGTHQRVIVTGASGGIERAIALAFARGGGRLDLRARRGNASRPRTLVARLLQGISNSDRADDTKPQEGEG
jgi:NAD(P)-dependent dehydrogenase (short-subunit alcohol dehydrogenase family)